MKLLARLLVCLALIGQAHAAPAGSAPPANGTGLPVIVNGWATTVDAALAARKSLSDPTTRPFVILATGQSRMVGPDPGGQLSATCSQAGTTLTLTAVSTGLAVPNSVVSGGASPATILSQLSGDPGGIGTYRVDVSQTVAGGTTCTAPKAVAPGIYQTDSLTNATAIIPATFGTGALRNSSGCTAAADNCNNAPWIQAANRLRISGLLPASRPIVVVVVAVSGTSIGLWMGSGTSSAHWQYIVNDMTVLNAAYPGATIDWMIWGQGEGDYTSGSYVGQSLYSAAFTTLMQQFRGLSQWRSGTTNDTLFSVMELNQYPNNSMKARNDFLRTVRDGCFDRFGSMSSSVGNVESVSNPGPHNDGQSDVANNGPRLAQLYIFGFLNNGYSGTCQSAPRKVMDVSSDTSLQYSDFASGLDINWSAGNLTLPSPSYLRGEQDIILKTSGNLTLKTATGVGLMAKNGSSAPTSVTIGTNTYRLWVGKDGFWHYEGIDPYQGGWNYWAPPQTLGTAGTPVAVTLNNQNVRGSIYQSSYNTFTLPLAVNGISGSYVGFAGVPTGGASTVTTNDASATIRGVGGRAMSTYTIQPGQVVLLALVQGFWFVVGDSFGIGSNPTTVANLPTCTAALKAVPLTVTDALAPTFGGTVAGGGAVSLPVTCDGTSAWKTY